MLKTMDTPQNCMFSVETIETKITKITYTINGVKIPNELRSRIFYTLPLTMDENGRKKGKHPKGWQQLEQQRFNDKHNAVAVLTGKKNNLYVIDYDDELNFKIDSELYPELKNYYEKTRKGYHCYFLYDKLASNIGSKNIKEQNIDFLGNGKCVYSYPTTYKNNEGEVIKVSLKNGNDLKPMSNDLYNYLLKKYIKNIKPVMEEGETFIKGDKMEGKEERKVDDIEEQLNEVMKRMMGGGDVRWTYEKCENYKNSYMVYCLNNFNCIVDHQHHHHEEKHSSIFICRKYIAFQCWSHGKKKIEEVFKGEKVEQYSKELKEVLGVVKEQKPKKDKNDMNDYQVLLSYLWDDCELNEYKKEDGYILKPCEGIPTFYENYMTFQDYLNELYSDRDSEVFWLYRKNSKMIVNLMDYLEKYNDKEIPYITRDKNFYSYSNGVLNIKEMKFYKWGKHPMVCTGSMFREEFKEEWLKVKFNKIDTPTFDKLIKHQIKSNKTYKMFCMMTGRLLFDVGELDNWQCMMFIHGEANTGKGTYIELVKSFFNNTGIISSTFEKTFGLQNIYDKDLIVAPDLPKDIHERLSGAVLQSMISGESVSVAVKNKKAVQVNKWTAPMLWCANFLPSYEDNAGSITRRMAIFKMATPVKNKDTRLIKDLMNERHKILVKMVKAYHYYIKQIGEKAFDKWDELGIKCFKREQMDYKQECNLLHQFLTGDPEMNRTKNSHKVIIYREGAITELEYLKKCYKLFLKYKYPDVYKKYRWSSTIEESAIKGCGYTIQNKTICAVCNGLRMCQPCNVNNRRKKKLVLNMMIKDLLYSGDADDFSDLLPL